MTNLEMIERLDARTYLMQEEFIDKGLTQSEIDTFVREGVLLYLLCLEEYYESTERHIELLKEEVFGEEE
ncbi:hypothetical protein [Pseudomonas sp.]|jgi:hypothetical protein|uniref:hypothetical protein n=1 Tax=Pseudomonas sp. TaxID=306 RepID=UPI00290B876F|nr:hypothetical protein [Pseudomonas sp.]MDU4256194.1 hypothetical protein [Pseudomonas sp.]